jgi:hypothetical protein
MKHLRFRKSTTASRGRPRRPSCTTVRCVSSLLDGGEPTDVGLYKLAGKGDCDGVPLLQSGVGPESSIWVIMTAGSAGLAPAGLLGLRHVGDTVKHVHGESNRFWPLRDIIIYHRVIVLNEYQAVVSDGVLDRL